MILAKARLKDVEQIKAINEDLQQRIEIDAREYGQKLEELS